MEATHPVSTNVSDYLGMLRRHWWVVLLLAVAATAVADFVTKAMPTVYESSTSVLVQPAGQDTNVVGGRTKGDINLDTEAQLVRSTAVATDAGQLLREPTPPDVLARDVRVEVPANTSVLVITYAANEPRRAQAGSHAFAEAYLRNRQANAHAQLDARITALSQKLRQLNASLVRINRRLAGTNNNSRSRPNLESQRQTSINQINNLAGDLNKLTTITVSAGKIISDARLPTRPSKPDRTLNLATGLMIGLLAGLALSGLRERFDRRIRRASEVVRRAGVPLLAELTPRTAPHFDSVLPPYGPGGRIFTRLRNEVLAGLQPGAKVLVVTGASPGPAATLVAANLAVALARAGNDVVLVGAHLPETMVDAAPLARLLGVPATPGLSDIIAGRVSLAEAAQRAPRVPCLRVITTGSTAIAAALIQAHPLRETLEKLKDQAEYVVVEAPSTATSADAQSLASLADAAILTVELRRTARPQVIDAHEQLRRVGTPLLGAVVLPRTALKQLAAPARGRPAIPLGPDNTPGPDNTLGTGGTPGTGGTAAAKHGGSATVKIPPAVTSLGRAVPAKHAAIAGRDPGAAGRDPGAAGRNPGAGGRVPGGSGRPPGRTGAGPASTPSANSRHSAGDWREGAAAQAAQAAQDESGDVTAPLPRLAEPGQEDPSLAETAVLRRVDPQQQEDQPADRSNGVVDGAGR